MCSLTIESLNIPCLQCRWLREAATINSGRISQEKSAEKTLLIWVWSWMIFPHGCEGD